MQTSNCLRPAVKPKAGGSREYQIPLTRDKEKTKQTPKTQNPNESVKASKLFRRAAEFVSGNRLAVSGDDHGFSNLTELCTKLEGLVGDDEPFMNVLRPAAEAARD